MTVAFDAFTAAFPAVTVSHTPVGTPKGVVVVVAQSGTSDDDIDGITYGGVAMTRVRFAQLTTGEVSAVYVYFLGSGIPTGTQSATITETVGGNSKGIGAYTLTAAANTTSQTSSEFVNSTSTANPSASLALSGKTCFVAEVFGSGQGAVSGTTPPAGWTSRGEWDHGTQVGGTYSYDTIGSTDVTVGWTQGADDALGVAVAITEVAAATSRSFGIIIGF